MKTLKTIKQDDFYSNYLFIDNNDEVMAEVSSETVADNDAAWALHLVRILLDTQNEVSNESI